VTGQESVDPPAVVFVGGVPARVGSLALVAAAQVVSKSSTLVRINNMEQTCRKCGGSGKIGALMFKQTCPKCYGLGHINVDSPEDKMDSFINRRIKEMTGYANVGDIIFWEMERTSPHFITMGICLNINITLMGLGLLTNNNSYMDLTNNSYMDRYGFFTRELTILVRGAATPNVMHQFWAEKEANYENDVERKVKNYQYLLWNSNIPSQDEAKWLMGLPSDW